MEARNPAHRASEPSAARLAARRSSQGVEAVRAGRRQRTDVRSPIAARLGRLASARVGSRRMSGCPVSMASRPTLSNCNPAHPAAARTKTATTRALGSLLLWHWRVTRDGLRPSRLAESRWPCYRAHCRASRCQFSSNCGTIGSPSAAFQTILSFFYVTFVHGMYFCYLLSRSRSQKKNHEMCIARWRRMSWRFNHHA